MTTDVKLTEHNEGEGETCHFWIPVEGNEEALRQLSAQLDPQDDAFDYSDTPVPEAEVDVLVKHNDYGYFSLHNKLAGSLTIPDEFDTDQLYKGGIKKLMA